MAQFDIWWNPFHLDSDGDFDTVPSDWADDEWRAIQEGLLSRDTDHWIVVRQSEPWQVWRGWGDDAHERLYRSPMGAYYLGTTHGRVEHPYTSLRSWDEFPLRAVAPLYIKEMHHAALVQTDERSPYPYPHIEPSVMRVVAAAWFLDRDQGGHRLIWQDCPAELQEIARRVETEIRTVCDCPACTQWAACLPMH